MKKLNWNQQKALMYFGFLILLQLTDDTATILRAIAALMAAKIILIDG